MTKHFLYAAILYLLFVVYGSLVPLDFKPIPLEKAVNLFKNIRYLNLDAGSRADWIANILLYIPLAFLWSAAFGRIKHLLLRLVTTAFVIIFCLTVAISIEFSQLFFPPRTVSVNDLIAETIGTGIGVIFWHGFGQYLIKQYKHITSGNFFSVQAAILFYLLAYLSLSFFPFDFVTSYSEFEAKFSDGETSSFISFDSCRDSTLRCSVKFFVEILVLIPLGILFSRLPYVTHKVILNVLTGFFLGVLVEGGQLFLISASGQGLSILTRMLGMGIGAILPNWVSKQNQEKWAKLLRPLVLLSIFPYVALATAINGWMSGSWLSLDQALTKLENTRFLPLYYFYYTSEGVALVSLLSNIGTYLPVGLMFWIVSLSPSNSRKTHWLIVGSTAAGLATVIETGKLFLAQKHADPTDVLIAFVAAAGTYIFLNQLSQWRIGNKNLYFDGIENSEQSVPAAIENTPIFQPDRFPNPAIDHPYEARKIGRGLSLCLLALIMWALYNYPFGSIVLGAFLIVYGFLLYRFPFSWLWVIPALLPVMDLTPWTGRFFFDEFDLVILTTLAYYYWKEPKHFVKPAFSKTTFIILCLFISVYGISLLKGLLPLQSIDANAFSNYYSHYNSLRVGKGFIWGLLLLPLLIQTLQSQERAKFYLGYGILIGLSLMSIISLMERFIFPGLLDFSTDFRINALFSSMHTGGGHIESYLVLVMPFIVLLFLNKSYSVVANLVGLALFIISLYVLLVTFSRGGYLGLAAGFVVLVIGLFQSLKSKIRLNLKPILLACLSIMVVPVIALPVLQGNFIQHRFSLFDQDKSIRFNHWNDAKNMMDHDLSTTLFGMGIGSYPRTYYLLNSENSIPSTYKIESETGNEYLRLWGGDPLYFGQYIAVQPHTQYRLTLSLRSNQGSFSLAIPICEKSLHYSFRCSSIALSANLDQNRWKTFERSFNTQEVGSKSKRIAGGLFSRPVQLALYNGETGKVLDIDNVALMDSDGNNLITNGDFTHGTDYWFFSTDNPWHVLNLWVQLLFDQGWLGVIAFCLLLAKAVYNLLKHVYPDPMSAILLASMTGFFVVGITNSPFDAPRLTLLFFLILFVALIKPSEQQLSQRHLQRI